MPIFVFRSEKHRYQLAFTDDKAGKHLPAELGPWYQPDGHNVAAAAGLPESVCAAIKAKGYVLMLIGRAEDLPIELDRRRPRRVSALRIPPGNPAAPDPDAASG
jgi:hypothetical protein